MTMSVPPSHSQEPLNSEDDVSDEEDQELFDTENVVVCQYDKVRTTHTCTRSGVIKKVRILLRVAESTPIMYYSCGNGHP
jgi:hypothetical protein